MSADGEHKQFSTLRAQAALAGHVLDRRVDEHGAAAYTASRWGLIRDFADLEAAERWLRVVTGKEVA